MSKREWFRAKIRWGVMVEGKEGLRCWEESIHVFVSKDRDTAFQHALEIGRQQQTCHTEGRRWVEKRLAQVVTLDDLGTDLTEFEEAWCTKKPTEPLGFEYAFDPERTRPDTMF
ncbi:MAG: hypothetical protein WBC04_26140 [Candidatus Acidiferrales bacterium]